MRKTKIFLLLLLACFLYGCGQDAVQINRFDLALNQPEIKPLIKDKETFAEFQDANYKMDVILYEYNTVVVVILNIENHSDKDLLPEEYSVSLADGRDLKSLKMLTRENLIAIGAKHSGSGNGNIQDQLINSSLSVVMNTVQVPTNDKLVSIINQGVSRYFSFRTIYAKDKRAGVLCFVPDFSLEYPLTLSVNLKGKTVPVKFIPRKK